MGLLSFLKRKNEAPRAKPVADKAETVQHLRVRARRRLIGAAVLVAVGVIGFPLLFETQPRPLPVNLPIDIPRKDNAPPLAVPAVVKAAPIELPAASMPEPAPEPASQVQKQTQAVVTEPKPAPATVAAPVNPPVAAVVPPVIKPRAKVETKPSVKSTAQSADAKRAQALLNGGPIDAKASDQAADKGRFIVQVGAFAEAKAAHDVRMKVEHLGLKTYMQAVDTSAGHRIRVRVGPFGSRDEAQQAANKLRGSGLAAAVLTL